MCTFVLGYYNICKMTNPERNKFEIFDTQIDNQIMMRRRARYNCAAATLCGTLAALGMEVDDVTLRHLSAGFAGGIGKTHSCGTCGAITGGVFALGLLSEGDDDKTARLAAELFNDFLARHGSVQCRELKGEEHFTPCDLCCLSVGRKICEMMKREGISCHRHEEVEEDEGCQCHGHGCHCHHHDE